MGDCFPRVESLSSDACKLKTGWTEYGDNYREWPHQITNPSFSPKMNRFGESTDLGCCGGSSNDAQRYAFSKGARFGIPPYCDCTPPPERHRFESTYQHDFFDMHYDHCNRQTSALPGVRPRFPSILPKQYLCPFSTETTYARAFDMPQTHFRQVCQQIEEPCDSCANPYGITIQYQQPRRRRCCPPKLRKEELISPGTDTSDCPKCPVEIPCCPCFDERRLCDACCGAEYPCKLHQATTTPTRKYPIVLNTPRFVPDPREPPRRPLLLCSGGTRECPLQNQFPTQAAIAQAKQRLLNKIEEERCIFPPDCVETSYRASFKTPPLLDVPKYCSQEMFDEARKAEQEFSARGTPPPCIPAYCLEGGRPADPRPMFDHLSTYQADYIWNYFQRVKPLGGEIPCKFDLKPLWAPKVIHASEVIKERTEEKDRWGENWECCPDPC